MRRPTPVLYVLGAANVLCLVVLVLFLAIQTSAFGMWFYRWQFDANATYERVGMEPEHLHDVTRHIIRYMQGREPRDGLQISTIVNGRPQDFFTRRAIVHMYDVYDLFQAGRAVQAIMLALLAATAAFFVWQRKRRGPSVLRALFRCWQIGAAAVFGAAALLVGAVAINWHRAFVIFHEIFFDNDYWMLYSHDLLLNIVPYEFFISISAYIGIFFALGLGAIFAAGCVFVRRNRQ